MTAGTEIRWRRRLPPATNADTMQIAIWIIIILVIAALLKYLLSDSGRK